MSLYEKHAEDGTPLEKKLDQLLAAMEPMCPGSRALFVHLRDLHDGAARLADTIAKLAATPPDESAAIDRLLWDIRVELYEHLVPNHLGAMQQGLVDLCSCLSESLD